MYWLGWKINTGDLCILHTFVIQIPGSPVGYDN